MGEAQRIEAPPLAAPLAVPAGTVRQFTHHKWLLANCTRLTLRAGTVRTLWVLLSTCDADGIGWLKPTKVLSMMPRSDAGALTGRGSEGTRRAFEQGYKVVTVLRGFRELKDAGFLSWTRVKPLHRMPGRANRKAPAVLGTGERTFTGGRCYRVELSALREALKQEGGPLARDVLDRSQKPPSMIDPDRSPVIDPDGSPVIDQDHGSSNLEKNRITARETAAPEPHAPPGHRVDAPAARGIDAGEAPSWPDPGRSAKRAMGGESHETGLGSAELAALAAMPPRLRESILAALGAQRRRATDGP
jgi:hypothetical protein